MRVTIELTEDESRKIMDLAAFYQQTLFKLMEQNPELVELEKTRLEIINKILIKTERN
ncbi:unnamed protein product [marine sediment metagenome]|uniref:Uncharacterized protein n=1 Tax=marine sediment metagenome TaxID=412755 RepID=X1SSE0_9ZZZZ